MTMDVLDRGTGSEPGEEIICEGVAALFNTACETLPAVSLGILRRDGPASVVLTHADTFGTTGQRAEASSVSDAFFPRSNLSSLTAADLNANRNGLVEARLLKAGMPVEILHRVAARQAFALPLPGTSAASLVVGLADQASLRADRLEVLQSLAARAGELLRRTESNEEELARLRRLEALEDVMGELIHVLDIREIFERLSGITNSALPHHFLSAALFSDDRSQYQRYADTSEWTFPETGAVQYAPVFVDTFFYHVVDNLLEHPIGAALAGTEFGARSSVRVPVRLDGKTVAALNFSSRQMGKYGAPDVVIARRIAEYVALAISHQQLAEESRRAARLRERSANLEMLDRLLGALTGVLDLRDVFTSVSHIAGEVLPHDAMGLLIITDDREHIIPLATTGLPSGFVPSIQPIPDYARHLMTEAWDSQIVDDFAKDREAPENPFARAGHRSMLRVPIRLEGQLAGALGFFSRSVGAFSPVDALIGKRIADHMAMVISHQRLADESRRAGALRERAANVDALDALLNTITGVLDVRDVFDRISAIGNTVMPHDGMTIAVVAGTPGMVRLYAATGALSHLQVPSEIPVPNRALIEQPWDFELIDDLAIDPRYNTMPSAKAGMRSLLSMPIRVGSELLGSVNYFGGKPRRFTRDDVPMARRITDHIALALSHERLAEEVRRSEELRSRTSNIELLDALLATVTDSGELRDVIGRISEIAQKVLSHDAMVVPVLLPDRAHVRFHVTKAPDGAKFPEVMEVPEYLRTSDWEYDLVDDLQTDPANRDYPAAKIGYRSALRVPIRVEGQLAAGVGFFAFTPFAYKHADIAIARRVADRLAISLLRESGLEAARRANEAAERASRLESRVQALTEELNARAGFHRVIGKSATWRQVLTQATQVASTETTVLLLGESGTGKEVVARFVHRASSRKNGPFVALNCAALPEQLLESELFGYERGAFTGAMTSRAGKLEQAAGGVLFLDEVGEMSPPVQAKFLRVLQEREFQRLGGSKTLKTDARVIAATNRDPKQAMERGTFREDLYYRLSVFEISLPPLRDRRDDILLLVESFLAEIAKSVGRPAAGISEDAKDRLLSYPWPGNVRELRNAIERAVILCEGGLISSEHLPIAVGQAPPAPAPVVTAPAPVSLPEENLSLEAVERDLLNKALASASHNKSQAAKLLGLPRGQFYSLLKRHGLTDAKR